MGWGDELMVTGQARALQDEYARTHPGGSPPSKVMVYDRNGRQREHELWRGNRRIATRSENVFKPIALLNAPGFRPYIEAKNDTQWSWKPFAPTPPEIYFAEHELDFAAAVARKPVGIVIEPNNKAKASPNKDWGFERWVALAALLRKEFELSQLGPAGTRLIQGVRLIETPSFRHAAAVLAHAQGAVLPEGGLHHAAAADKLDPYYKNVAAPTPAVVIYGGFISPAQTGYPGQASLFTGGKPCGMRIPCKHCADAMAAIPPEQVAEELRRVLSVPVNEMLA